MKGLIGRKVGMTQLFADDGSLFPATVIEIKPNVVVALRLLERDGYSAVVLGSGVLRDKHVSKPYGGQFSDGIEPVRHLIEIRNFELQEGESPEVGDTVGVELFAGTSSVDVSGTSKGKGYQGVMKRHGFAGGQKTHGSKFHRAPGSTGQSATPSKVHKGKKMPGRMGGASATVHNLRLFGVDAERNLLLVGGACPGRRGGTLLVTSAKNNGSARPALDLLASSSAEASSDESEL